MGKITNFKGWWLSFIIICLVSLPDPSSLVFAQWEVCGDGNDICNTNPGNVGIGTLTPTDKLTVEGSGPTEARIRSLDERAILSLDSTIGGQNMVWTLESGVFRVPGLFSIFDRTAFQSRLAINTDGNVGIGTTNPDQLLSVNGNASKIGGGAWASFSDERLKTIHGRFNAGLEEILKLKPIRYRYKKDNPLELPDEGEHIGFSAQEVQKVIPEAVSKNSKGYLMLNNDPVLWAMLNAIKEQQKTIEELKKKTCEIADLKARLEVLERSALAKEALAQK